MLGGDIEAEIRVSLGGNAFTTTFAPFTFFPTTDPLRSVAAGPGLTSGIGVNACDERDDDTADGNGGESEDQNELNCALQRGGRVEKKRRRGERANGTQHGGGQLSTRNGVAELTRTG